MCFTNDQPRFVFKHVSMNTNIDSVIVSYDSDTFELSSFHEWIEESTFIAIEIRRERAVLIQKAKKKTCIQNVTSENVSISNSII